MTTTYDRDLLANEALANLFADGGSGQNPDSDDVEYVKQRIDALLADLDTRAIVSIPDADDIEPAYFLRLAELLANECSPKFGKPKDLNAKEFAEEQLRILVNRQDPRKLKLEAPLTRRPFQLSYQQWLRDS